MFLEIGRFPPLPNNFNMTRTASLERITGETQITLKLKLDGTGCSAINTGHAFFDHMLDLLTRHSCLDITLSAQGDLAVDAHHTVEDVGIVLGESIAKALGYKRGITRYAVAYIPMDETLCRVVMDLSNRPYLQFNVPAGCPDAPNLPLSLVEEFCRALSNNLRCNLHVEVLYGRDGHHIAEAIFKGIARALKMAVSLDPAMAQRIPSTKGRL